MQECGPFENALCSLFQGRDALLDMDLPVFPLDAREDVWDARCGLDLPLLYRLNGVVRKFRPDVIMAHGSGALKYAALPPADWTASTGGAEPILASGVKAGGVSEAMLSPDLGVWAKSGDDLYYDSGRVGVGRLATNNALEVEGDASKTTAGSWLANSDGRIKTDVRELEDPLATIRAIRLVDFEYSAGYRAAHPSIEAGRRYPNVIAQEFAEVFPDWVSASGERLPGGGGQILQVDTYPLTIYSAAAIQQLAAQNAALRERVEKLEASLERLLRQETVSPSRD